MGAAVPVDIMDFPISDLKRSGENLTVYHIHYISGKKFLHMPTPGNDYMGI
ncbi:conserved hypothetical protein [delta proteobacterium NaphS2]|nr:conserved hypothetical protein [delta proteobacterium NaphS2]